MSHFIQQITQNRRQRIKKFESRVLNRSCADLFFYDKLADYLLQCCSAQAKSNTISVFSFLPLVIANAVVVPGEWWSYLVAILALLMHQVFDIANKKQAYRLSEFNLSTYYLDHLYDSISCIQIVDITSRLFLVDNSTRLTCMFFFGMLPFFTHHLAMYANGYLTFYTMSPAVQGLLILQILFAVCAIFPSVSTLVIFGFKFSQIFIGLCTIWLVIFLVDDIRTIAQIKKDMHHSNMPSQTMPVKNLFVITVVGYVMMEMTTIQVPLLSDGLYFIFTMGTLTLMYTFLISELVLSYGLEEKHRQFNLNTLIVLFWVVVFYSVCGWANIDIEVQILMGRIVFGVLFGAELIYFLYYHSQNVKYLNNIIKEE